MIMKKIFTLIAALTCFGSVWAQKAIDVMPSSEIFDIITYRYITLANEEADAQAVIDNYVKHFTNYGYTHELPGEGYGGPCAIIDGFYKDGVNDTENYVFVPDEASYEANWVTITACNDGENADYGYIIITFHVYTPELAELMLDDLVQNGFELIKEGDNIDNAMIFQKDNKVVAIAPYEDCVTYTYAVE